MSSRKHRSGGKIGGSHTTVIDAASPLVDFLETQPAVKKIVLGRIDPASLADGERRVKISKRLSGLRCVVRGKLSIQELWIYISSGFAVEVIAALTKKASSLGFSVSQSS